MEFLPCELARHIGTFLPVNDMILFSSVSHWHRRALLTENQQEWLSQSETATVDELLAKLEPREYQDFKCLFSYRKLKRLTNTKVIKAIYELDVVFNYVYERDPSNRMIVILDILRNDEYQLIEVITDRTESLLHSICQVHEETQIWPLKCLFHYLAGVKLAETDWSVSPRYYIPIVENIDSLLLALENFSEVETVASLRIEGTIMYGFFRGVRAVEPFIKALWKYCKHKTPYQPTTGCTGCTGPTGCMGVTGYSGDTGSTGVVDTNMLDHMTSVIETLVDMIEQAPHQSRMIRELARGMSVEPLLDALLISRREKREREQGM